MLFANIEQKEPFCLLDGWPQSQIKAILLIACQPDNYNIIVTLLTHSSDIVYFNCRSMLVFTSSTPAAVDLHARRHCAPHGIDKIINLRQKFSRVEQNKSVAKKNRATLSCDWNFHCGRFAECAPVDRSSFELPVSKFTADVTRMYIWSWSSVDPRI